MRKFAMNEYLLEFCTKDADILDDSENRLYWRCQAENYNHAVEQLKNAEPSMNWCDLIKINA
jgi:hypothetical protein